MIKAEDMMLDKMKSKLIILAVIGIMVFLGMFMFFSTCEEVWGKETLRALSLQDSLGEVKQKGD